MEMADPRNDVENLNTKNGNFICGVVEGFYGRPWTTEQRKDLFQKLKKWGMDSYLYAPKDDYKHRAYWRELYTVEEADHLTGLISAAKENGISFYYALSPGLDITYSSAKEVCALKRKLEQVSQFGCDAFALLFDDIEPEMSEADKEVFQSFAHAQVSITNEIYEHLNHPKFLVCPTQYCAARAMPTVQNSEYLNTLGSKLAPQINIMWTGAKVITRVITVESIEEITEVLRRPPVIWDNLHANDYDQKRVFLGPYQGRSPDLIPKLRGVLTNPNCEYGANFVGIHTLAQWSRCSVDGKRELNDSVSADIKLETETEDGGLGEDVPSSLPANTYHPRRALHNAITEWLPEFSRTKQAWGPIVKPQPPLALPIPIPVPVLVPSVNTCISLTSTTTTNTATASDNSNQLHALAQVCSTVNGNDSLMQPITLTGVGGTPVMNSLISENKVLLNEPMDCNTTPNNSPAHVKNPSPDVPMTENTGSSGSVTMQVEPAMPAVPSANAQCNMLIDGTNFDTNHTTDSEKMNKDRELRMQDVSLLCDLFYLPFEHGSQGVQLLQEFNWLKSNAFVVTSNANAHSQLHNKPEVEEWFERSARLAEFSSSVNSLFQRLTFCSNRFSKGWKESFMSGDQEPWVFRGGLTADLQRLIPVDSGSDLFVYKAPDIPTSKIYTVRPYIIEDEIAVYDVCRKTCIADSHLSQMMTEHPDLAPDRFVGAFLTFSPELCFVVEDETGIVGYACAALDAKQFHTKLQVAWLPEMCAKYPTQMDDSSSLPAQEMIRWFHSCKSDGDAVSDAIKVQHPSTMTCSLSSSVFDQSVAKRLVICVLAALRANGSFGVHVPVNAQDRPLIEFYSKLGFIELTPSSNAPVDRTILLGRAF